MRRPDAKSWALNAFLLLPLIGCWLLGELLFPLLLPRLPVAWHYLLDEDLRPLAQSSKAGLVPHDYILLLGDSYALGYGDWLLNQGRWANGPYSAAHVIHAQTGRDVLALGHSGAGSIRSLVDRPARFFTRTARHYRLREAPAAVVVFFYEGNDLDDNLRDLKGPLCCAQTAADLDTLLGHWAIPGRPLPTWLLAGFVEGLGRSLIEPPPADAYQVFVERGGSLVKGRNRLVFGGRIKEIEEPLQGPGAQFNAEETDRALGVFAAGLGVLADRWPTSPLWVVYLPAPTTCYRFAGGVFVERPYSHPAQMDDYGWFRPGDLVARSNALAAAVRDIAYAQDAAFLDARGPLRALAREAPIHGPQDWRHFNEAGYRALGELVAETLKEGGL